MTELQQIAEFKSSPELVEKLYQNSVQKILQLVVSFRMKIHTYALFLLWYAEV